MLTEPSNVTGYARLKPREACVVLAVLVVVACFCVGVTLSPLANNNFHDQLEPGKGDVALYRAEIDRIHAGESYYDAAGEELRARGYPTGSLFNWRFPIPQWLIGLVMPSAVLGKALLCGLALALMLTTFESLAREEQNRLRRPIACGLLLTGPLMPCVLGDLFMFPVLWGGVLIALSICAYALDRPRTGVALGIAAVFFRELAMPYCLVAMAIAWWYKRRGELAWWIAGLALFTLCYGLHCLRVSQLITSADQLHKEGWVQFGGAAFVIATAQMNAYLLLLPQWVTALYFVAALFGFAGWHTPMGQRVGLTACAFVVAFAVAGQEFNQYWGSLTAPLLCFGVIRFPASLRDTWKAAFGTALEKRCVASPNSH